MSSWPRCWGNHPSAVADLGQPPNLPEPRLLLCASSGENPTTSFTETLKQQYSREDSGQLLPGDLRPALEGPLPESALSLGRRTNVSGGFAGAWMLAVSVQGRAPFSHSSASPWRPPCGEEGLWGQRPHSVFSPLETLHSRPVGAGSSLEPGPSGPSQPRPHGQPCRATHMVMFQLHEEGGCPA